MGYYRSVCPRHTCYVNLP